MHVQGREPVNSLLSLIAFLQTTMTNIQLKETDPEAKPDLFAGIDVGAEELILVIRKNGKPFDPQKFANTPADRDSVGEEAG